MGGERLLERISRWEEGKAYTGRPGTEVFSLSIVQHLHRILNTKEGSAQIDPRYGIPDYTNLAGSLQSGTAKEVEVGLKKAIERLEPRLKSPQVRLVEGQEDALALRFELTGTVEVDDREVPVRLSTTVAPNGKVSVQR